MSRTASLEAALTHQKSVNADRKVILLEFNELTPELMDRFIAEGKLPNFKRLKDGSQVFISDAEEAAPNLEPWIQWATVHSGQSFDEHGIFHLGDGHKLKSKQIWDVMSDAGLTVWVCGSMNIRYDEPVRGAVLPDPWAAGTKPYPQAEFEPYFRFVQRNVQEYTNDRVPLSVRDYVEFLSFMVRHGLSLSTVRAIVSQLVGERLSGRGRWKRAIILDRLQWDVFEHGYKKMKPNLATMFLNSTAHFQHMYWRNMEPSKFKIQPSAHEQQEYENAVLYGYQQMDELVGRALQLAGDKGTVILSSALGQQPCLVYEDLGGKTFYRPRTPEALLKYAGITGPYKVEPVMSEQFHITFASAAAAEAAAQKMRRLKVVGASALLVQVNGAQIFTGCCIFSQLDKDIILDGGEGEQRPFFRIFYQVEGLKSGMHHPDGILWIRTPDTPAAVHTSRISLRRIAPTILSMFGLRPAAHMTAEPVRLEKFERAA